ncbi:DNA-processing protein DprA [Metaclostridioides mangenotii]|uniref:DNA-processing protein DprA n=1 Tax=Metaclostridioides mangenotii TaxID=1540 RepID=UPI000483EDF3|nr:DNA-processing protein DprA [Clostridioides mangenotii]
MEKRDMYLMLKSIACVGNIAIEKIEDKLGDLEILFDLSDKEIYDLENLNLNIKKNIVKYRSQAYLDELKENLYKKQVEFICSKDELYPKKLRNTYNNPKVLFYKGNIENIDNNMNIAMIGSRKPTYYGINCARKMSRQLSDVGINVVSGLAMGIDSYSHLGCIEGRSKTIAVLGSGVDNPLPKKNIGLANKIIEDGGLLLSEYNVNSSVKSCNFYSRNRIVSGISDGVVVVEAAKKSGSLITVDFALEQGKNIFSVPGNINSDLSKGCNKIIKEGAKLIEDIEDILEEYNIKAISNQKKIFDVDNSSLNADSKRIVSLIKKEGNLHIDKICDYTGIDIKSVNIILSKLQLEDIIIEMNNNTYSLNV